MMEPREAVRRLVAFVDAAPALDETAQAARIVLQALKERDSLVREIEAPVRLMTARLEAVLP
jgi:hypothetical protein